VELYPLKSDLVLPGDSLAASFVRALYASGLRVKNGDIIAVASKAVSIAERNIVSLSKVRPTALARKLGRRFEMLPEFVRSCWTRLMLFTAGFPAFFSRSRMETR
jgi:coenzyme F420-0:L-glutamate ligase / coenzyme F420-1:gamma-L-glutamate ligase